VGTSKITGVRGSRNKPIGCGASGAYASGPDDEEEEQVNLKLPMWPIFKEKSNYLDFLHIWMTHHTN